ncbi:MAG: hypothetical protein EOO75_04525 [Myxococcales bacterium]|nr:MAG: hypothetical protein EOO75_04525 [Myxococcales bacterium]
MTGVLVGLTLWTLLQAVPLPLPVLSRLSPHGARVWLRAMAAAGQPAPSWAPLSLAPEMTLVEAAKWGGYAMLSWIGVLWARQRGLGPVAWAVMLLAVGVGALTVLHGVLDAEMIFGFYRPHNTFQRWSRGPLLNVNHLSAYLSLGLFACMSLLLREGSVPPRTMALLLVMATSLVTGIVGLASRAAVTALALGALVVPLVLLDWGGKRTRRARRQPLIMLAGVFGLGLVLALYGFGQGVTAGLGDRNLSKLIVVRDSLRMVREFWLTGVGRGAFEGALFRYKSPGDFESWTHPENGPVQWMSEWGVPMSLLAVGLLVYALVRASGWRTSRGGRLLALGLAVGLLHDLLDYHFEIPAIGGLGALLLGALVGAPPRTTAASKGTSSTLLLVPPFALTGLVTVAAVLALSRGPQILRELRLQAYEVLKLRRAGAIDLAQAMTPFAGWMRRYPAEPYLPTVAGLIAVEADDPASLRWLGWSLERGPRLGLPRLAVAEALARRGQRQQALLEIRIAIDQDPLIASVAVSPALALVRSVDEVIALAPRDSQIAVAFLEKMAANLEARSELIGPLRERILLTYPCAVQSRQAKLARLLAAIQTKAPPCSGSQEACRQEAEEQLRQLRDCPDTITAVTRLRGELQWATGDRQEALKTLEASCDTLEGDLGPCMRLVAERTAELRDLEQLRRTLRVAVARQCQDTASCGQAWAWAARLHERAGDLPGAMVAITKASENDPSSIELRYEQARVAAAAGAPGRAEQILQQILLRRPGEARAQQQLDAVRATMAPRPPPR